MPPQATPTTAVTSTPSVPLSTSAPAGGQNEGGLSQAQVGGILAGVVGFVVVVLLLWYWISHSEGYLVYRSERHERDRLRRPHPRSGHPQWQRRRRRRSYDSYSNMTDSDRRRHAPPVNVERMRYMAAVAAQNEAAAVEAAAAERLRKGVAMAPPYVLNPAPVRFPPTARRTNYRQTAYPQFPGVKRVP